MRTLALVDGEHYPPVTRWGIEVARERGYDVIAAVLVGGIEKLARDETPEFGVPVRTAGDDRFAAVAAAIDELSPDLVLDLSDEPILGYRERMAVAAVALARGVPYVGPDFRFDPPARVAPPPGVPTLAVVGTGKRTGKTAVAGEVARAAARRGSSPVVVAMGRGGPPEPELVEARPTIEDLVELSRAGRHAASDHLEIAALTGVTTIGCRRAGGGLAGGVTVSNVAEGARLAAELEPDLVLFDGSGASIPPIATSRRVLVTGETEREPYLDTYRRLVSDLVLERPALRLRPTAPLEGSVAVFTAGATDVSHLDADVVHVSTNLSDREALRHDLVDADTYLVEIKAAGIDVVATNAVERGIRVVAAANDVVGIDDAALLDLAPAVVR
jgi:cyclic 2,3-diphosphoglycerate synthase